MDERKRREKLKGGQDIRTDADREERKKSVGGARRGNSYMEGQARERGEVGWVSPFVCWGCDWSISALVGSSSGTTRKFCGGLFSVVDILLLS